MDHFKEFWKCLVAVAHVFACRIRSIQRRHRCLVAVLTARMAKDSVDSTFASAWCVSSTLRRQNQVQVSHLMFVNHWPNDLCAFVSNLRSPSGLFSHPADLGLAHQTADPVTAVFLLDDHLTFGTVHCLAIVQELLERKSVNRWQILLVYWKHIFKHIQWSLIPKPVNFMKCSFVGNQT